MPFLKGNKLWDNEKSKSYQFKKGVNASLQTQFQKGKEPWNKGKTGIFKHTDEWKKERSESMKEENHPNWKGGLLFRKPNEKKHLCSKYREWTKSVKSRDKWKCKISNQDCKGNLEAHHILNWIEFPELRYQVNNGITLCQAHHPRKRAEEKRLFPYFMDLVSVSNEIN